MNEHREASGKNVAAQHHDEMAAKHERDGHRLDTEHREPEMPAHARETADLHRRQARDGDAGSTVQVEHAQHLSADEPDLDGVDAASADSFPTSDPPSSSTPSSIG